jgi:hypothetical protein|mmetsp:Transcript_90681/g.143340  ORF Transcript_90681/g.143340 Transcript_90681/m.143340 type:complete len:332 (+) Transcript_90681:78-1073(+)
MGKKGGNAPSPPPPAEEEEVVKEEDIGELRSPRDFLLQDGSTYSGSYLKKGDDVCFHGEGLLQSGPDMFRGTFERGQYKHGEFKSCNGSVYYGYFYDNKFHGWGEYTWNSKMPNERSYRGMWKNGAMHGKGEFRNFSFGTDKVFKGFSFQGRFASGMNEQDNLKKSFLDEYGGEYSRSARAALLTIGEKTQARGEMPEACLVPKKVEEGAEEKPEAEAERTEIEALVSGPFPSGDAVPAAAMQAFVTRLAEDAEKPLVVRVLEDTCGESQFLGSRLYREQLQHVGQAVEFDAGDVEVGAVRGVVMINVSKVYDISAAKWKLIHVEEMQAPT